MPTQLTCTVPALGAAGDLQVYDFAGNEGLSELFSFEVIAASVDAPIPLEDLIRQKVKLSLTASSAGSGHQERTFHGIVTSVTDWGEGAGDRYYFFYRMTVRPLAWLATLNKRSRVFRSSTVPQIVEAVLKDNGLAAGDFRLDLQGTYPLMDYAVQHEETDWDFVCRLVEHEGIFFHFVAGTDREVLVFRDANPAAGSDLDVGRVHLVPSVRLQTDQVHINQFAGQWRMTTGNVAVWDHDYEDFPSANFAHTLTAGASEPGLHGTYEEYDERNKDPHPPAGWSGDTHDAESEAQEKREARVKHVAEVRRQELMANQGKYFSGSSNQAAFTHGSVFELVGRTRSSERYADVYLVTSVRHVGSGRSAFMGLSFTNRSQEQAIGETFDALFQLLVAGGDEAAAAGYANSFTCIPAATPYRPPRRTPWPRIPGVVTGKIERYPGDKLLDQEGRYMVRLRSNQVGEAPAGTPAHEPSRPVRMAQWLSLRDGGVHFPTEEGAETVVAFIDGDPDRPIIVGMVPNMATHAPVPNTALGLGSENPDEDAWKDHPISYDERKNVVRTSAGHQLVLDDDTGKANVGVTLQAGETPPEPSGDGEDGQQRGDEQDHYWGSKLELGGHRAKGKFERDVDAKTQGVDGLGADAVKPGPLKSLVRQAIDDRDYWEDASSNVTPVGAQLFTNNRVELVGKNGIDLHAPNLAGGGQGPGPRPDVDQNRGRLVALSKFLGAALWRAVFKRLKDKVVVTADGKPGHHSGGPVAAEPILHEIAAYDKARTGKSQEARAFEALRLPGIQMTAAGPVKMASYLSVDAVTGKGGFNVESFGDIAQRADLDARLEAGQFIKIRTTGKKLDASPLDAAADQLKGSLAESGNTQMAGEALRKVRETLDAFFTAQGADNSFFPILVENENGGIILHTEGLGGSESKGHIDLYAEEEGDVRLRAMAGKVAAHSTNEIVLKVEKSGQEQLGTFYDGAMFDEATQGARVALNATNAETFAKEFVRLQTFQDDKGNKNAPSIQIDGNSTITLQCGQSMIRLKNDGTIDIEGIKINLTAKQSITQDAKMEVKTSAMNVTSEAKVQQTVKGALTNVEASGVLTEKGGMVMIN